MTNEGEAPEKYFLAPVGRQSEPLVRGGCSAPVPSYLFSLSSGSSLGIVVTEWMPCGSYDR